MNPQCGSHTPPQNEHFGAAVILWQRRICLFQLCAKTNERFLSFHAKTESEYDFKNSFYHQVTYSVNADGGYVAEVSYEGTAVFPEVKENQSPQTKLNQKCTLCPGEALCPSSCGNRLVSNLYDVAFTVFRRPLYKLYLVINFHLFRIQADNGRFIQFEQTIGVIFSSAKLRAI